MVKLYINNLQLNGSRPIGGKIRRHIVQHHGCHQFGLGVNSRAFASFSTRPGFDPRRRQPRRQRRRASELAAERIVHLATIIGLENVMSGTDCGFAQSQFARGVHTSIMWTKCGSLVEGARIATPSVEPRSRLAVAPSVRQAPALGGHALTAASTRPCWSGLGRRSRGPPDRSGAAARAVRKRGLLDLLEAMKPLKLPKIDDRPPPPIATKAG